MWGLVPVQCITSFLVLQNFSTMFRLYGRPLLIKMIVNENVWKNIYKKHMTERIFYKNKSVQHFSQSSYESQMINNGKSHIQTEEENLINFLFFIMQSCCFVELIKI